MQTQQPTTVHKVQAKQAASVVRSQLPQLFDNQRKNYSSTSPIKRQKQSQLKKYASLEQPY